MSSYSEMILATPGLVGYWRLGEPSGSTAVDDAGSFDMTLGGSGTTLGDPGAIFGDADTAYTFAGAGVLYVLTDPALELSTGSIECWIKLTEGDFKAVVCKEDAFGLFIAGDCLAFHDWSAGTTRTSTADPTDGAWHHVVFLFESGAANGSHIYLDGVLVYSNTMTAVFQNKAFRIGAMNNAGTTFPISGSIDEVAIYNVKLDPADIEAHYDLGVNGPPSSGVSRISTQFQLRPY